MASSSTPTTVLVGAAAAAGLGLALLWSQRQRSTRPSPSRGAGRAWLVAVLIKDVGEGQWDHPMLSKMPSTDPDVQFIVGNSLAAFESNQDATLDQVDALLITPTGDVTVLPNMWERMPNCKWVHSFSAGVDKYKPFIDSHLGKSSVPLTNGRGAYSTSLAEYVMSSALYFNKQVVRCQENRRQRKWDRFVMDTLHGKTMGFVGFGHIAQCSARLARAFGMRTMAIRRNPDRQHELADVTLGFDEASKLRLCAESDFVVCTLPDTPETRNFIGAAQFKAMKRSAAFISLGRGVVVDEAALNTALSEQQIAGAALDVFAVEPLPEDSPLWDRENLLVTAHNADLTADFAELGWATWRANLDLLVAGRPLATVVNKKSGY